MRAVYPFGSNTTKKKGAQPEIAVNVSRLSNAQEVGGQLTQDKP